MRAPHGRKVIGDGRNGNAEFSGQTPVSRFVAFFTEIVALEDAVRDLFAVLVAPALELVDSQGEEIADPLAVEILFRRQLVRRNVVLSPWAVSKSNETTRVSPPRLIRRAAWSSCERNASRQARR